MDCKVKYEEILDGCKNKQTPVFKIEMVEGVVYRNSLITLDEFKNMDKKLLDDIAMMFQASFNSLLMEFGLQNSFNKMEDPIYNGYLEYRKIQEDKKPIKKKIEEKSLEIMRLEKEISKFDSDILKEMKNKLMDEFEDLIAKDRN